MIPAQPFSDWLNNRVAYWEQRLNGHYCLPSGEDAPAVRVARECGWIGETGTKRLYRFRHRLLESAVGKNRHNKGVRITRVTDWFPRDVVEDALHEAGVLFADVYPEIAAAEDVFLEPAKWCAGCREERTPINGICARSASGGSVRRPARCCWATSCLTGEGWRHEREGSRVPP
jgi:hypothetical protein